MDDSQEKQSQLIGRVETTQIKSYRKLLLYVSIFVLLCDFDRLYENSLTVTSRGVKWWLNTVVFIALPVYALFNLRKLTIRITSQFIEWYTDKIIFNTGDNDVIILLNQIKLIEIKMNSVEIQTADNEFHTLSLFDYTEHSLKKEIKQKFEEMKGPFVSQKK